MPLLRVGACGERTVLFPAGGLSQMPSSPPGGHVSVSCFILASKSCSKIRDPNPVTGANAVGIRYAEPHRTLLVLEHGLLEPGRGSQAQRGSGTDIRTRSQEDPAPTYQKAGTGAGHTPCPCLSLAGERWQLFRKHPAACRALSRAGPSCRSDVFALNYMEAPKVPTQLAVIAPQQCGESEACTCPVTSEHLL